MKIQSLKISYNFYFETNNLKEIKMNEICKHCGQEKQICHDSNCYCENDPIPCDGRGTGPMGEFVVLFAVGYILLVLFLYLS